MAKKVKTLLKDFSLHGLVFCVLIDIIGRFSGGVGLLNVLRVLPYLVAGGTLLFIVTAIVQAVIAQHFIKEKLAVAGGLVVTLILAFSTIIPEIAPKVIAWQSKAPIYTIFWLGFVLFGFKIRQFKKIADILK